LDAAIATGPALLRALLQRGWIGRGPLFAYGLSFGGSQAAAMACEGGFAGLILEGTAADIAAVGRNFVPGVVRPFVKLSVDPALRRFDYLGYAAAARAPVLLISTKNDEIVRERNMRDFAQQLKQRGLEVSFTSVPGRHGDALAQPSALAAIRDFVARNSAH
jgi:dienelactone hydrolase